MKYDDPNRGALDSESGGRDIPVMRLLLSEKRAGMLRLVNPDNLPVDSLPLVYALLDI